MDSFNTTKTISNNYDVSLKIIRTGLPPIFKSIKNDLSHSQAQRLSQIISKYDLFHSIVINQQPSFQKNIDKNLNVNF